MVATRVSKLVSTLTWRGPWLWPLRGRAWLGAVRRQCVHVHVHLHLILQDLHQLLHGGQVTGLQLRPHRHVCGDPRQTFKMRPTSK